MINSGISLSTTNVCYTNCTFATNYVRSLLTPLSSQQEKSFLTSQKRKRERKSERAVEKTKVRINFTHLSKFDRQVFHLQTCFCHLRKLMHDSWERVGTRKARGLQKADAAYLDSSQGRSTVYGQSRPFLIYCLGNTRKQILESYQNYDVKILF